jgi:hypothetical protein
MPSSMVSRHCVRNKIGNNVTPFASDFFDVRDFCYDEWARRDAKYPNAHRWHRA